MATARLRDIDSALIDSVCSRVRERLGPADAPQAEEFIRQYYRRVPPEDLAQLDPLDVYGAALAHWSFARQRDPGTPKVRAFNPEFEQHGWQSSHTVVELVSDDMPFLVDSTTMELSAHGAAIHLQIHPVMRVRRDGDGELTAVLGADAQADEGTLAESFIHVALPATPPARRPDGGGRVAPACERRALRRWLAGVAAGAPRMEPFTHPRGHRRRTRRR